MESGPDNQSSDHYQSNSDSDHNTRARRRRNKWRHPRLTGYRIILMSLTASFGITKAILAYNGQSVAPNSLDWTYGVVCTIGLYWLGLYEKHPPPSLRWMFKHDFSTYISDYSFLILFCMVFISFWGGALLVIVSAIFPSTRTALGSIINYIGIFLTIVTAAMMAAGIGIAIVQGIRWLVNSDSPFR